MRKSTKQGLSLKWGLLAIMAFCWIVPITVILVYSGYSISNNVQDRIKDTITTSVDIAFQQTVDKFSSAMDASRASSYDETIDNAYAKYKRDKDGIVLYDTVTTYLLQQYGYDDSFNATFLFFTSLPDDIYYASNRMKPGEIYGLKNYQENIHQHVLNTYADLGTQIGFMQGEQKLYMVRNIVDRDFKPYAVIVMECNEVTLFESLCNIVWLKNAIIRLDNITRNVVGEGNISIEDNDGVHYDSLSGTYNIQASSRLSGHALKLSVISDSADLVDEFPNVTSTLPLIGLFAVPLLLYVMWAYYHYISRPVDVLVDAAAHMEAGERGYTVKNLPQSREFRYLTERFNSMSTQLEYQFERSYQEQLALQDARVKALRSQINPHFLNNTLEAILWVARMAEDNKVCRMIEALSMMLDAATARGGRARGSVQQELSYTEAYLYILSERLGDRLTITKEIDPQTLNALVPCLILQPIVENAIEHGIALRQKGELILRSRLESDALILEVENDGVMTQADKEAVTNLLYAHSDNDSGGESRECIGIRNVNRRLKILYGEEGGLMINGLPSGRTLARIVIPHVEFCS